ncbi:MAG: vancomycin resistance protein [Clostridia bacterium]|jgi:vancomycin resistance protein VanW|nr:vancomycin resistance protein [Clostridia bacterium]
MNLIKPIKRSRMRLMLGKAYYIIWRHLQWIFGKANYARTRSAVLLDYIAFSHQTPLIRKLKDVDMWLQYNKVDNLKIALKRLNGIVLKPGETLSYWKLIGKPSKRKGYKEGVVLYNGGFKPGIGGGLCQLSNLIYWLTLHTPLEVVERYRHSYDVFPDANRTQPFGSGATCVYNYRDLQIWNNTNETYQLHLFIDEEYLNGQWRCSEKISRTYQVYEKKHWITHEYWGGYIRNNVIYRRVLDQEGNIAADEYVSENHAIMMYAPLLKQGEL